MLDVVDHFWGSLELLAEGLSNKEIANKKNIAPGTVRNHLGRIFKKLHVRCRSEATAKYFKRKQEGGANGNL